MSGQDKLFKSIGTMENTVINAKMRNHDDNSLHEHGSVDQINQPTVENPVRTAKRRRQTYHDEAESNKMPKLDPAFDDISNNPLSTRDSKHGASKSFLGRTKSPRSMKALKKSVATQKRIRRRGSKVASKIGGSQSKMGQKNVSRTIMISRRRPFAALQNILKSKLRQKVSEKIRKRKLTKYKDYSLPSEFVDASQKIHDKYNAKEKEQNDSKTFAQPYQAEGKAEENQLTKTADKRKDTDLQQKIDHEIKMREGTTKLLAASKHPNQRLEAARSLHCSNTRIIAYMTELQRRKTQEVLGQSQSTEGNQLPCRAQISVSDIRIPLMWKDTDHFKNKGDYRQYAVFCLLKIGTEIFDTSMTTNVDRSMTDITFEDVVLFQDIPHDFELKLEVYCHKLHEELSVSNTPKKIRKKITDISGSVGRSVGKRLSGLGDSDVFGSMVLGPRFEPVAKGTLQLHDVDSSVRTFDFELERNSEGRVHELPLFGNYCCRVAAVPDCLVKPVMSGYLNVQEDDDLSKWRRYWCVLKNLQLACWLSPADIEVMQPLFTIPVTKSTQISDADPTTCKRAHTFLIKTVSLKGISEHTVAADSMEELNKWWDGFQQHLLDQALWKHACDEVMDIKAPTKNKVLYYRKSSIYEDTPLIEPDTVSDSIVSDLKVDDAQLSQMLTTLMGEASQIRGNPSQEGATS